MKKLIVIMITLSMLAVFGDAKLTSTRDNTKVKKSGDTMTGDLHVPNLFAPNVQVSTDSLQTQIDNIEISSGAQQAQLAALSQSTTTLQQEINDIGIDTGTLQSDLQTLKESTVTLTQIGFDTGTIAINLQAVKESTVTLTQIGFDTGTLRTDLQAVKVSTGAPRAITKVVGFTKDCDYVCDGTGDDVEIQNALNSLTSSGTVILREGTYKITTTITMAGTGVRLIGQGRATALESTNTSLNGTIEISGNYNSIENMLLTFGTASGSYFISFYITGTNNTIKSIIAEQGNVTIGTDMYHVRTSGSHYLKIIDCSFTVSAAKNYMIYINNSNNCIVENNYIVSTPGGDFSRINGNYNTIKNNEISGNINIMGNYNIIVGNYLTGTLFGFVNLSYSTIIGNIITQEIQFSNVDNCLIQNNHAISSGRIFLQSGCDYNTVTGNKFYGSAGLTNSGANNNLRNNTDTVGTWYSDDIGISTGTLQQEINDIGIDTGTLQSDLQTLKESTVTLTQIGFDTGTIAINLQAVKESTVTLTQIGVDTATIRNLVNNNTNTLNQVSIDTATIRSLTNTNTNNLVQVGIDTSTIKNIQNQVQTDTATLRSLINSNTNTLTQVGIDTQTIRGLTNTNTNDINQLKIDTQTVQNTANSKITDNAGVIGSTHIADGAITENKTTPWKVALDTGTSGLLPSSKFATWNSTHVIAVVFGSTDGVTGLLFSSATADIPIPYDITLKSWCIDACSLPVISGNCTVSISTRTFGGTYGVIDGGIGADNTKRPNMISQTSSSGTTAGWSTTTAAAGGCLKITVLTSSLLKQITVGLQVWKNEP